MSKTSGIGHYYRVISCIELFMIFIIGYGSGGGPVHECPAPTSATTLAFQSNLRSLLPFLVERASTSTALFHNTSTGQGRDRVYGRAVCQRAATCSACLRQLNYDALQLCPARSEAFLWNPLSLCSLQYGHRSFFGTLDSRLLSNGSLSDKLDIVPDMELLKLVSELVETSPNKKSRSWNQTISNGASPLKLGVAQCTPDLSVGDCLMCLQQLQNTYFQCCHGKGGWYVVKRSCYIVYGDKSTFITSEAANGNASTPAPDRDWDKSDPSNHSPGSVRNANGGLGPFPLPGTEPQVTSSRPGTLLSAFLGGSFSIFLVVITGCSLFFILRRKKKAKGTKRKDEEALLMELGPISFPNYSSEVNIEEEFTSTGLPIIDLATLIHATNNFSNENKLGEGGFGPVYKGVMRDGREIAIKRLSKSSGQGLREFKNEIILVAKLQHKNLVRLLNCCVEGGELLLVYEFLANKSLDIFLFDSTKRVELDWQRRLDMILGIARGVQYLHEDSRLKIIHRDLKASNILLDHEMRPKISDFGMARIFESKQNHLNTCRVVGTFGYMAPEYAMEGIFSVKSDVYSFGVLLLEIVSGKRNAGFYLTKNARSLLEHAWQLWCEGKPLDLIDPFVIRSYSANEALRCIHIGLLCVQQAAADRPTMSVVVLMLASASVGLPRPNQPAFLVSRESIDRQNQSSTSRKTCSINEITVTCVEPR